MPAGMSTRLHPVRASSMNWTGGLVSLGLASALALTHFGSASLAFALALALVLAFGSASALALDFAFDFALFAGLQDSQ